ncbi:uncharacterized protein LOC124707960 [Lolium rigidum]|uniref:uncharacterized protein LOC124707960 n=1 Tax=Lolium rigidum TaxID=89674 RepID=UPI001F5E29AE|nr:uncharacterized protein LOC124707960 [Lolium rigidum]
MGKKRVVAATKATATPIFPFTAAADQTEPPHHFSDYGFDPQLLCFPQPVIAEPYRVLHSQPETKRFKLHKPISKKHQRTQTQHGHKQRRRWWSSAAAAALHFFFKRPSSSSPAARAAGAASSSSCSTAAASFAPPGALYFADDGGDEATGCACWSPALRSGRLAAAELGVASVAVPYASLRDVDFGGGVRGAGWAAPSMPIYLVT